MNKDLVQTGLRVRTGNLQRKSGILADPRFLANRKEDAEGVVGDPVPGHDGAWWVRHGETSAPYWFHELEPLESTPDSDSLDEWMSGVPR